VFFNFQTLGGKIMPAPRKSPDEKKENFTVRIKQKLINDIKKTPNYTIEVEKTLNEKFGKKE
jgi:hypothetical protein